MLAVAAAGALLAHELVQADIRQRRTNDAWAAAVERARQTGRNLVVVGDPQWLGHEIGDDSSVVFCPFALELVDDPFWVHAEMLRIAGSRENVFIVAMQPWSIASALRQDAKWQLALDRNGHLEAVERVTELKKTIVSTAVTSLLWTIVVG